LARADLLSRVRRDLLTVGTVPARALLTCAAQCTDSSSNADPPSGAKGRWNTRCYPGACASSRGFVMPFRVLSCISFVMLFSALLLAGCGAPVASERPSAARRSQAVAATGPDVLTPVPIPTPDGPAYARGIIRDLAVVYQNGDEHAENVELHLLPSRKMLLAFRAGGTGQAETRTA